MAFSCRLSGRLAQVPNYLHLLVQPRSAAFGFDGASRITNVSDGTYQAGYSRLANSALISQIDYRSNSTTPMTTTKSYDYLNRLRNITSTPSASGESPIAFDYTYNDVNQRTRVNMTDRSFGTTAGTTMQSL